MLWSPIMDVQFAGIGMHSRSKRIEGASLASGLTGYDVGSDVTSVPKSNVTRCFSLSVDQ